MKQPDALLPPSRLAIEVGLDRCHDLASRILSSIPDDRGGEAGRVSARTQGGDGAARPAAPSKTSGEAGCTAPLPGVSAGGGDPQPAPACGPPTGGHAWPYPAVILAEGLAGC